MLDDQSTWLGYSRIDGDESPPSVHFRATSTKGARDAITGVLAREARTEEDPRQWAESRHGRDGGHAHPGMIGSDLEKALNEQALLARTGKVGDIAPIAVTLVGSPASTFLLPVASPKSHTPNPNRVLH